MNTGGRGRRGLELGGGGVCLWRDETESLREFVSGVFEDVAVAMWLCHHTMLICGAVGRFVLMRSSSASGMLCFRKRLCLSGGWRW